MSGDDAFELKLGSEQQSELRVQRQNGTAAIAPKTGAAIYSQRIDRFIDTIAGPIERAGFIDAPEIGPPKNASNPTTAPTASPISIRFVFGPAVIIRITHINNNVITISQTNE